MFFILHKVICMICDQVDGFCFPLLQRDYYAFHKYIDPFCFSLLQKDIDTFSQAFLCFFFVDKSSRQFYTNTRKKIYDFYIVYGHVDTFCFSPLQKTYFMVHKYIDACFFLLQQDIDTFLTSLSLLFCITSR